MADAKHDDHGGGGGAWLGITVEILFLFGLIATFVYGAGKPFTPTFLNLDFIFGKMLVGLTWIVNFANDNNVGFGLKVFMGFVSVFLIGFDFYLLLRILEMEDEHVDHAYHHAVDDQYGSARPQSLVSELISDIKEIPEDTKNYVKHVAASPETKTVERIMYETENSDLLDPNIVQKVPVKEPSPTRVAPTPGDKEGSSKWRIILKHINSNNPSDWKLSIIEADTILDTLVERSGFPGDTLGERMKNADPGVFRTLKFAKEAHFIRNRIAHEGPNFVLTDRDAKQTIKKYEEVFREFDYI